MALLNCLNEGLNDDESDVDFQFADEAIDSFVVRFPARQGDITGAVAAVLEVVKRFVENTCCPDCKWRRDAERVTELAEGYCDAEAERSYYEMDLKCERAAEAAARLLLEEEVEKKRREQKENAVSALKTPPLAEPLPESVDELRVLVKARDKAMQKARAAANKPNKTTSKADREAAAARVQGAHAAREAAVNALSRAERHERARAEREAARARDEKSAAAVSRAAAERAEREVAAEREAAHRLALRLQRAELLAVGWLNDAPAAPFAMPVALSAPLATPAPAPASVPMPMRKTRPVPKPVPIPVPIPVQPPAPMQQVPLTALMQQVTGGVKLLPAHMRPLPPAPQYHYAPAQYHYAPPWFLLPEPWMYHSLPETPVAVTMPQTPSPSTTFDDIESTETDETCIVCMDASCDVTTTCCSRTFMCAACSACVLRCPLCSSIQFVCLPDELL
jgi:hypothetical protein